MENPRESSSWTWKLKKIRKSISLVWKILQTFLYLYPIFPLQKKKKNISRNPRVEILQLESSCTLKLDRPFSLPLLLSIIGWNCCRHRRPRVYTLPPNQIFIWWCIRDAGSFHASNPSPRGAERGGGAFRHRDAVSTRASSLLHVKVRPPAVRGLTQQIGFPLAVLCVTGNGL